MIKATLSLLLFLSASGAIAGCLEPEKSLTEESYLVEQCNFRNTTDLLFEDSRLKTATGKARTNADLTVSKILGEERKVGKGQIRELPRGMTGVILKVRRSKEDEPRSVYYATSDTNFCKRFVKSTSLKLTLIEKCCDCDACVEPPCSLGTKFLTNKIELAEP